jgi:hypothetical protein
LKRDESASAAQPSVNGGVVGVRMRISAGTAPPAVGFKV